MLFGYRDCPEEVFGRFLGHGISHDVHTIIPDNGAPHAVFDGSLLKLKLGWFIEKIIGVSAWLNGNRMELRKNQRTEFLEVDIL